MVERLEVAEAIDRLVEGAISREAASDWANVHQLAEDEIDDPVVEEALDLLVIIDAPQTNEAREMVGYLFDLSRLSELRSLLNSD